MHCILRCAIFLLIADSTMVNFRLISRVMATVAESFEATGIVPDVVQVPPQELVTVKYPCGKSVELGNELTPTQVKEMPCVSYKSDANQFYTLVMTDPDVPSRKDPSEGEFKHWLVGNIPGCNIGSGEALSTYHGSAPPENTDLHRYVFLVYLQPCKLSFDEPKSLTTSDDDRYRFSISDFAKKYNLGDPIAGNFFLAQFASTN